MIRLTTSALALAIAGTASMSHAAEFDVAITNVTAGVFFTPLLVSAHSDGQSMFMAGATASAELQAMAEGGDISGLATALSGAGAVNAENPAGGLLSPGATTEVALNTDNASDNTYLSIVAMMLPTNDGFVALNQWKIPSEPGVYPVALNAYDAGTEANDEVLGSGAPGEAGFPAPPPVAATTGTNGTGIDASVEGYVHIHRGVTGDADTEGGQSDIDLSHRWLNPVAKVVVTVK